MIIKLFWKEFIAALAALSSVATLVVFICDWNTTKLSIYETLAGGLMILAICICYGLYQIQRKKKIILQSSQMYMSPPIRRLAVYIWQTWQRCFCSLLFITPPLPKLTVHSTVVELFCRLSPRGLRQQPRAFNSFDLPPELVSIR